ncbi:MAG: UDP-N-acetylmuramoyl-tripeptide--D-alanyl-D-alanine ligase [Clostridiales bacterium]|jgi:UDP-N-acetylmuramoyl-tripeptide--D-alanyl-D-alanine ligase|nr:UDP-N-acetylmuramoyl-tripeptide--D-alanyl-D-alanine ligase [Clostridiales bacterium]
MKPLKISEVAEAVGGRINNPEIADRLIIGVSFDTREAMHDMIFVPLKGKNTDGHNFLHEAMKCGAACVFSEIETYVDAIMVKDAAQALKDLAEYYRSLFDVKVVGITGSNGKTSTKDMVAAVLAEKYNVVKTIGNFNNEIGLPTTIFNIDDDTDVVVLEMGMNHRGEISRLSKIARPDYAIITNIGVAHIENLGSQEEIFKAKSEILDYLAPGGKVYLSGDDNFLARYRDRKNFVFYGYGLRNTYRANEIEGNSLDSSQYAVLLKDGRTLEVYVPTPGKHMVMNSLAAVAVGEEMGLAPAQIADGIKKFKSSGMRMNVIETNGGMRVIDDCYNASPDSVKAALEVLLQATGNTMAILGDMLELGEQSYDMHFDIGAEAARLCIDTIICVGENSEATYEGAYSEFRSGASNSQIIYFNSKHDCMAQLDAFVKPGDTILVKASRGMRFEDIVRKLVD